jgi:peptide/nickel transport system permease protein
MSGREDDPAAGGADEGTPGPDVEEPAGGPRADPDAPLAERIRARPGPAAAWALGALVLLALELGRVAGGLAALGRAVGNVGGTAYGRLAGALTGGPAVVWTVATVAVGAYLLGLAVVTWTPLTAVGRVWQPASRRAERLADGLVVGIALAAAGWLAAQAGAVGALAAVGDVGGAALGLVADLPTLTARETIPNRGYQMPDGTWRGTFLGLSAGAAWALRVLVVHLYLAAVLGWSWVGYLWYRRHYRVADWTPRDDVVRRLRRHRWGQFGLLVVFLFLTMALFAPALGPTTLEANIYEPFSHEITHYDEAAGEPRSILVGQANLQTQSEGYPEANVGPLTYDQYDRYHPFGTLTDGSDLYTFLVHGARVSLVIGLLSVGLSALLATVFALVSAYYRGLADLVLVVTGDTIMGVPRLLLLILLTVVLADTWLAELYDGGVLLALVLAATGWPFLWRAFRGPTLQVAEEDWVDAARSYGQSPGGIMRLHMLPYLLGYLLIYSSLVLGGVILAVAGLSFLGLGITDPTPEWGRAVDIGREYVATDSWHISLIPGLLVTLVVMGFNAVGDALRDAVDPKSDTGATDASETESRGGGV